MSNKFITASEFHKQLKNTEIIASDWRANSTVLLHGPREVDKTNKALELASSVVKSGHKVLYVDANHTLDVHIDAIADMESFYIFSPSYESPDDQRDYADLVILGIEEAVKTMHIKTIIVNSVSRIAALSFGRNASAAYIMKRLVALQMRCGLNLLVSSHDSTRATDRALISLADSEISLELPDKKRPAVMEMRNSDLITKTYDLTSSGLEPPVPINEDLTVHRAFRSFSRPF